MKRHGVRSKYDPVADQTARWNLLIYPEVAACVEKVLRTMAMRGLCELRDTRLQVAVTQDIGDIWAHFPMYKARLIVRHHRIALQPGTKVLLVIPYPQVVSRPHKESLYELAHHFGHVLCYLRKPRWIHDCPDADREAKKYGLGKLLVKTP